MEWSRLPTTQRSGRLHKSINLGTDEQKQIPRNCSISVLQNRSNKEEHLESIKRNGTSWIDPNLPLHLRLEQIRNTSRVSGWWEQEQVPLSPHINSLGRESVKRLRRNRGHLGSEEAAAGNHRLAGFPSTFTRLWPWNFGRKRQGEWHKDVREIVEFICPAETERDGSAFWLWEPRGISSDQ